MRANGPLKYRFLQDWWLGHHAIAVAVGPAVMTLQIMAATHSTLCTRVQLAVKAARAACHPLVAVA
jgi:hypothetical protein